MKEQWYEVVTDAPVCTIREFAEKHGLKMQVTERALDSWSRERRLRRWMAQFARAEVKRGACLASEYGQGDSHTEAIADYANNIAGEILVIDAYGDNRREIRCPNYFEKEPA